MVVDYSTWILLVFVVAPIFMFLFSAPWGLVWTAHRKYESGDCERELKDNDTIRDPLTAWMYSALTMDDVVGACTYVTSILYL